MNQLFQTENDVWYWATLSDCKRYRWTLKRIWDRRKPPMGWIMLNPSTADASEDDPTIRRCMGFAKRDNFGGIEVRNLFSYRATDPKELLTVDDPIGDSIDGMGTKSIVELPQYSPWIAAGWGALHPKLQARAAAIVSKLAEIGIRLACYGVTKEGHPRHPLYLPSNAKVVNFDGRGG